VLGNGALLAVGTRKPFPSTPVPFAVEDKKPEAVFGVLGSWGYEGLRGRGGVQQEEEGREGGAMNGLKEAVEDVRGMGAWIPLPSG